MGISRIMHENWSSLEAEIADELVREEAVDTCQGRACYSGCSPKCRTCCCKRKMVVNCTFFLIGMAVMCIVLLIMLMAMMVVPYLESKKDKPTTCTVLRVDYDSSNLISCRCSRYCRSDYPCLNIAVSYPIQDGSVVESELQDSEVSSECTYAPSCSSVASQNARAVLDYKSEYGKVGSTFSCLYDPTGDAKKVIRHRVNDDTSVTHMVVWPLALAAVFVLAVVAMYKTCGCKYTCTQDPPQRIKLMAATLRQHNVYTLQSLPSEERKRLLRECAPAPGDMAVHPPQAV